MDNQIAKKSGKAATSKKQGTVMFTILKNIIIAQNKMLMSRIAKEYDMDEKHLCDTYIKPEYYLPVVTK